MIGDTCLIHPGHVGQQAYCFWSLIRQNSSQGASRLSKVMLVAYNGTGFTILKTDVQACRMGYILHLPGPADVLVL